MLLASWAILACLATAEAVRLGPGDLVEVTALGQSHLATVTPAGTLSVEGLGTVPASGDALDEVEARLTRLSGPGDPVRVRLVDARSRAVMLKGEVRTPGQHALAPGGTLVDALEAAGGFTPQASGAIRVTRAAGTFPGGERTLDVTLVRGGPLSADAATRLQTELQPGDLIVAAARRTVLVEGEVQRPAVQELTPGLTLLAAIERAGGATRFGRHVRLQRAGTAGTATAAAAPPAARTLEIDLHAVREGKSPDLPLEANDRVLVKR